MKTELFIAPGMSEAPTEMYKLFNFIWIHEDSVQWHNMSQETYRHLYSR